MLIGAAEEAGCPAEGEEPGTARLPAAERGDRILEFCAPLLVGELYIIRPDTGTR